MADVPANFIALLKATPAVVAIANGRIVRNVAPHNLPLPLVWIQQRSTNDVYACVDDAQGLPPGETTCDVECWAKTSSEAAALAATIKALNKFRGMMGEQRVCGIFVEDHSDDYLSPNDMSDSGAHYAALNVEIFIPVTG